MNLVRALSPSIGGWTTCEGKHLKFFDLRLAEKSYDGAAGQVVECGKKSLSIVCGDGKAVSVLKIQAENAKKMDIASFLCGKKIPLGTILGQ